MAIDMVKKKDIKIVNVHIKLFLWILICQVLMDIKQQKKFINFYNKKS